MTSLRERAEQAGQQIGEQVAEEVRAAAAPLPEVDVDTSGVPADLNVNVHLAWAAVMADVQAVGKGDKRQDAGGRYNFRGIDRILNAVGPALRKHGVAVIPEKTAAEYSTFTTGGNKQMRLCTVTVDFRVYGPRGDSFPMQVVGEAFDAGDKAAPKAQSVALRVALINALAIPTEDPAMDADRNSYEIAAPKPPTAEEYARVIESENTSINRLLQIRSELGQHPDIAQTMVTMLDGTEIKLGDLLQRVGRQRQAAK